MMSFRVITLLAILLPGCVFGQDYEAQLRHREEALVGALEEYLGSRQNAIIEFRCVVEKKADAASFVQFHSPKEGRIEAFYDGRFLGVVEFEFGPEEPDLRQWLRTQFFIGVAFRCYMDAIGPKSDLSKAVELPRGPS